MDSAKQLRDLSKVYMEAVYGGGKKEEKKPTDMVVTNADKKANTKAYQNLKAGVKGYKAADHLGEGKKAEKDFDGDGKLESPEAEYKGSKDKAIKKELKDLQKAANTLKGMNVAKADVVPGVGYKEETILEKQKDTPKQVAAVIDYYRSKKGTGEAVKDTEEGDTKDAKKERDYAAWERSKMKKDDPNWKHKKGSTSESVESDEYIDIIREIKSAETQADIKRWKSLEEGGKFSDAELAMIIENDLDVILVRLESAQHRRNPEGSIKDRFKSTQTDPSKDNFTGIGDDIGEIMRQNAAMKKAAEAKKKKVKEELEIDEGIVRAIKKAKRIGKRVLDGFDSDPGRAHTIGTLGNPSVKNDEKRAAERKKVKEEFELDEAERSIADRLDRKNKLMKKTVSKAMDDAMRTGEASGHNRFNMSRLGDEIDKLAAKNK